MLKKFIIISAFILMVGCQNPNLQETPSDTSVQLFMALTNDLCETDDAYYEDYVKLFHEYAKENATRETFDKLRGELNYASAASHATFEIMQLNNGQMLLVYFVAWPEDDKYEIYDIYVVPEEIKDYFKDIIN